MKYYFFIIAILCCLFNSCTYYDDNNSYVANEDLSFEVNSTLSPKDFLSTGRHLQNIVNTRASLNNEDSCKKALQPLIKDGEQIRKQIIFQANISNKAIADSLDFLKNMSESELAALSFVVYNLNQINDTGTRSSLTSNKLRSCVAFAVGLDGLSNLSLRGVISATTLRRALFAIGKRYLGYIGIALMIADFYDCFYN